MSLPKTPVNLLSKSNEEIGSFIRNIFRIMSEKDQTKEGITTLGAALLLVDRVASQNQKSLDILLGGVDLDGENYGNWKITIERQSESE